MKILLGYQFTFYEVISWNVVWNYQFVFFYYELIYCLDLVWIFLRKIWVWVTQKWKNIVTLVTHLLVTFSRGYQLNFYSIYQLEFFCGYAKLPVTTLSCYQLEFLSRNLVILHQMSFYYQSYKLQNFIGLILFLGNYLLNNLLDSPVGIFRSCQLEVIKRSSL